MEKLNYITVTRAIAVIMVLTVHIGQQATGPDFLHPYIQSVIHSGARGVQLFYIISAFTLFYSYNYHVSKDKRPTLSFYIRRFFRIAPLFYLAIFYYLWQDGFGPRYWLGDAKTISAANIASNFVFLHSLNPYWINSIIPAGWSVSIEVIFYVFFPVIFRYIKNINHACVFFILSLLLKIILFSLLEHHQMIKDQRLWNEYLFLYLPNQLPFFSLGIVLFFVNRKEKISPIILLSFFVLAYFELTTGSRFLDFQFAWFGLIFLMLIIALKGMTSPLLFNKTVYYIGNLSYAIYLVQFGIIHLFNYLQVFNIFKSGSQTSAYLNFIYDFFIGLIGCILTSTALHFIIERPAQKFGKKIILGLNEIKKMSSERNS